MRVAYLDCFAGISGDMFLGALLDAGVEARVLEEATAAMQLGASLRIGKVDRCGITSTKVDVIKDGRPAEDAGLDEQVTPTHQHQAKTQHLHKGGHDHEHHHPHEQEVVAPHEARATHSHAHEHEHGRSLTVIRELIRKAALAEPVKAMAVHAFELLGMSEAKIHNVPVDAIHFHEVGAVDAIVDIVAACAGVQALNDEAMRDTGAALAWRCSPLNVGGGMVLCAHGTFPVPAPATADLLRGMPTYSAHVQQELVTPTGAALVRALAPEFGQQPAMRVERIGYGAGGRNPDGFANVLRLSLGESSAAETGTGSEGSAQRMKHHDKGTQTVTVLETALDDSSPQVLAHVMERALAQGALDAMTTAVGMKKGRQGTLLTVLCDAADATSLQQLLLRETSTLGVRRREESRSCLERSHVAVDTAFGTVRVKVGTLAGETLNAQPEFEDCRSAAAAHAVPVKRVLDAAVAAYASRTEGS